MYWTSEWPGPVSRLRQREPHPLDQRSALRRPRATHRETRVDVHDLRRRSRNDAPGRAAAGARAPARTERRHGQRQETSGDRLADSQRHTPSSSSIPSSPRPGPSCSVVAGPATPPRSQRDPSLNATAIARTDQASIACQNVSCPATICVHAVAAQGGVAVAVDAVGPEHAVAAPGVEQRGAHLRAHEPVWYRDRWPARPRSAAGSSPRSRRSRPAPTWPKRRWYAAAKVRAPAGYCAGPRVGAVIITRGSTPQRQATLLRVGVGRLGQAGRPEQLHVRHRLGELLGQRHRTRLGVGADQHAVRVVCATLIASGL